MAFYVGMILTAIFIGAVLPELLRSLDERSLELDKCPACFGINMCPQLVTGQVKLEAWSRLTTAFRLNAKNVYLAEYLGQKVVIKKLGHNSDHEMLDNYILSNAGSHWENQECNHVSVAIRPLTHQFLQTKFIHDQLGESGKLVHHLKLFNKISDQDNALDGSDMLICPSQRKIDYIEEKVFERNQGVYRLTFLYNFMTTLLFNSEPLIFQAFPEDEGWPFARHLGACGRYVVEEYVGPNLAEWLPSASWKDKVNAALQLLKIAEKLNQGVDGFRLYLTDVSLQNVAINVSTSNLKVIDGENIVVVDLEKMKQDYVPGYDVPYQSDNGGCEEFDTDLDCVSYSTEDLCNRLVNDHNWFVVCRQLYRPSDDFGLLNGIPKKILDLYPMLLHLQQTCYQPSDNENRTSAARKLIEIYSYIVSQY